MGGAVREAPEFPKAARLRYEIELMEDDGLEIRRRDSSDAV